MGRLNVPKAPKKRSDCVSKSKIIARAVFGSLFTSKKLVLVASRRILGVCPPSIYDFPFVTPSSIHPIFQFDLRVPVLRVQPHLTAQD